MRRKKRKPGRKKTTRTQPVIVVGVLLLIAAILILKGQKPTSGSAGSLGEIGPVPTAPETGTLPQPVATMALSSETQRPVPTQPLPEAQLDQFLAQGRPILAFFHSNTCVQCVRMNEIVQQVYPDFADTVALVDVNVYDQRNGNLLQRANIRAIPTMILLDRTGQGQGYMGVMEPAALREQLQSLSEE